MSTDVLLWTFVTVCVILILVLGAIRLRNKGKSGVDRAKAVRPREEVRSRPHGQQLPGAEAARRPQPAVSPRQRSPQCEAIRQKLRPPLMYDEGKIDRLVAMERELLPRASDADLHAAAYERWLRCAILRKTAL